MSNSRNQPMENAFHGDDAEIDKGRFSDIQCHQKCKILSLTLVKVKNGYKPSNYAGCSHSPFRNDLCYFFVSSVLVLFIMLRIVDFEINS